jgi:hypothetical protein
MWPRHDVRSDRSCACAALRHIIVPQVSQYLEGYLWPFFDPAAATDGHVMSILVMVNEKFREGVPAWTGFHSRKVRNCQRNCSTTVSVPAFGFRAVSHVWAGRCG